MPCNEGEYDKLCFWATGDGVVYKDIDSGDLSTGIITELNTPFAYNRNHLTTRGEVIYSLVPVRTKKEFLDSLVNALSESDITKKEQAAYKKKALAWYAVHCGNKPITVED